MTKQTRAGAENEAMKPVLATPVQPAEQQIAEHERIETELYYEQQFDETDDHERTGQEQVALSSPKRGGRTRAEYAKFMEDEWGLGKYVPNAAALVREMDRLGIEDVDDYFKRAAKEKGRRFEDVRADWISDAKGSQRELSKAARRLVALGQGSHAAAPELRIEHHR